MPIIAFFSRVSIKQYLFNNSSQEGKSKFKIDKYVKGKLLYIYKPFYRSSSNVYDELNTEVEAAHTYAVLQGKDILL